ncbi:MAG: hypothetical protein JWO88_2454 [Frankiales bacterium]|nr:hypothetical protein [Frankiales bacterium]
MFIANVALLAAAAAEPVLVLSPAWLPAHALRWMADGLAEHVDGCPARGPALSARRGLEGWAAALVFADDVRAGLGVAGLQESLLSMIASGVLVADGPLWSLSEDALREARGRLARLEPGCAAVLTGAAVRWQRAVPQVREAV